MAKVHDLVEATHPWFSPAQPKPMYESDKVAAYCDIPIHADQMVVIAIRTDARFVDRGSKTVMLLGMIGPG